MWKTWLILSGIFLIVEIINLGFLIFWFSMGALIAMIVSFFTNNLVTQIAIFLISSTCLLFVTKPFVNKFLPKDSLIKTNSYSLEGKNGKVITEINSIDGTGQVKVNGEVWSAKSEDDRIIPKDSNVVIEKIEGVKVIVKQVL